MPQIFMQDEIINYWKLFEHYVCVNGILSSRGGDIL